MSLKKVVSVLKADESVEKKKGYGVGCDFGFANFAVFVDSYGNVTKIPGSYVDEICKPAVFEGNCSLLDTFFAKVCAELVKTWKSNGANELYVGCCNGDFSKLYPKEITAMGEASAHQRFLETLKEFCKEAGIKVIAEDFDEAYTSRACSIAGDPVPSKEDSLDSIRFTGDRPQQPHKCRFFEVDDILSIDADVNGAANILRKGGYDIWIMLDSKILEFIYINGINFGTVIT